MENKYKMICLDLDGTLLTSERVIEEETLKYLKYLNENNIMITIATGRPVFEAKFYASLIGENTHIVCSNGASAKLGNSKEILFEECFEDSAVEELCKVAKKEKIRPVFYTSESVICTGFKEYFMQHYFKFKCGNKEKSHIKLVRGIDKFLRFYKEQNIKVQKAIFFIFEEETFTNANNNLDDKLFEKALTSKICFEISKLGVNKSFGIQSLCNHVGITLDEVIAFGDSENDRRMLETVGKGVAMGNAAEEIKTISDEVTVSNDNQGIYLKLKEIFN